MGLVAKQAAEKDVVAPDNSISRRSTNGLVEPINVGVVLRVASSERVIRALRQLILWRGKPNALRCDNGPEYVSQAMLDWAGSTGSRIEFIQPGQPQQNACIERFKRTVPNEWRERPVKSS